MPDNEIILEVGLKLWLKSKNDLFPKFSLGPGDVTLMKSIQKNENLTKATKEIGYSYKYGWKKLKDIEKLTGVSVVESSKGGSGGGGHVTLTEWGKYLISKFEEVQKAFLKTINKINHDLEINSFHNNNKD